MQDDQTRICDAQRELFSHQWDEVSWDGQPLYPIQLPLEEILRGSPIPLHRPYPATRLNAVGTPRCGTKWLQRILTLLTVPQREPSFLEKVCKPILDRRRRIAHFHEGILEDYKPSQKIVFIYRDVRDAVVSGYVYIKTGQHPGMMNCTHRTAPGAQSGRGPARATGDVHSNTGCGSELLVPARRAQRGESAL